MVFIPQSIATATKGIINNNCLLGTALQADVYFYHPKKQPQAILAWGKKPSRKKAEKLAQKLNAPILTVEDGFLRSLDSGTNSRYGASFVVDDVGIYFDLTTPNRLQTLIAQTLEQWNDAKFSQAHQAINKIVQQRLSKYNASIDAPKLNGLSTYQNHMLVIDQVANDASINGAGVGDEAFYQMLASAIKQHPQASIWIKAHPAGIGILTHQGQLSLAVKNYLDKLGVSDKQVCILSDNINPIALLEQVSDVYSVSSHMGFEALLLNKTVHCFGVSWYAAFGLTMDAAIIDNPLYKQVKKHHQMLGVTTQPNIYQLFYAAYIAYSHYANPATKKACDINEVIDYLVLNRDWQHRWAGDMLAYEFSRWKVDFMRSFLGLPKVNLQFKAKLLMPWLFSKKVNYQRAKYSHQRILMPLLNKSNQQYLVWGLSAKQRLYQTINQLKENTNTPKIWCMEDGFIRSNGLGASLLEPLSVVVDDVGIYYDATKPSRLESILTTIRLTKEQICQAQELQSLLLTKRVSKYNVGTVNKDFLQQIEQFKSVKPNRKIHLVVGQVEDDASVQNCASQIRTNAELLSKVRTDFADDIVIYKPHPDIEAGLRVGGVDTVTLKKADLVAHHIAMPDCLDVCQVVHTISSLTGFEALIRGLDVVCYGMPFYAGFGLTTDIVEMDNPPKKAALERRIRQTALTIDELIFATLVLYPIYRLPHGYGLATAKQVIDYLYDDCFVQKLSLKQKMLRYIKTTLMLIYKVLN